MLGLFITKAFAQIGEPVGGSFVSGGDKNSFGSLVNTFISGVLNPLVYLFVGAGVVYFLAGVLKYMRKASDDKEHEEGRKMMLYGIIALFVMVSVWGLVRVLQGTFVLDNSPDSFVPTFRL